MVTASTKIKYYYIKYCCVHGGCHKKKKNTLDQRVTSTMRQGCEAFIYLKASANGQQLEITKMDETHNHETSKILYSHVGAYVLDNTTEVSCSCLFYKSMRLPCKHIFHTRQLQNKPLYDLSLCDTRWTRDYYYKNQRVFKNVEIVPTDSDTTVTILHKKKNQNKFCRKPILHRNSRFSIIFTWFFRLLLKSIGNCKTGPKSMIYIFKYLKPWRVNGVNDK
ncbi:unnamed protein product [Macrosiphum euphorbiae]|uniref:SWIM-type domain-containing protein n=1 Tax=Macrosiphum euphorbiae TaxID=13131 RepID=A0AAV0XTN4_9HEMI|nr:unnamed protein product [Macrosiphum euphorbiae]